MMVKAAPRFATILCLKKVSIEGLRTCLCPSHTVDSAARRLLLVYRPSRGDIGATYIGDTDLISLRHCVCGGGVFVGGLCGGKLSSAGKSVRG